MNDQATEWISAAAYFKALKENRPNGYSGRDSVNVAKNAGFRCRASLAVFLPMDGSNQILRRERDFPVPPVWWATSFDPPLGFQYWNMSKSEASVIITADGADQKVMLYGLSFLRVDVETFFGVAIVRPDSQVSSVSANLPRRRGFADADAALLVAMRDWIGRTGRGVTAASEEFAAQAKGGGSLPSKAKRLERAFLREFREH